jgi:hypothetical protein
MGLADAELDRNRQAIGIDQSMDLGRQPALLESLFARTGNPFEFVT